MMNKWISVKDELPEKYNHKRTKLVLLWSVGSPHTPVVIGYGCIVDGVNYPFEIKCWKSVDSGCDIIYGEVTHWQSLPMPPLDEQDP